MFRFFDDSRKLQKCCFYFPLGQGLRAWGIFKLVVTLALLFFFPIHLKQLVETYYYTLGQDDAVIKHIIVASLVLVALIVDSVFQFYFMVGVFKKEIMYLKFYETYSSILLLTLALADFITCIVFTASEFSEDGEDAYSFAIFFAILITLFIQFYVCVLVSHNIKELESTPVVVSVFARLENSEAEDEYTMRIEI
ncbi:unnamed protein product [Arctia plantaginis]|uniref:Uncharacterized protein n=1 Tax=Arctia plantaginis TaxID=874455 RepID=A0A8S0Z584_ARCPL|nr:unnamed protein product [Arctia plantaginis]